jgi:hypothetical protein
MRGGGAVCSYVRCHGTASPFSPFGRPPPLAGEENNDLDLLTRVEIAKGASAIFHGGVIGMNAKGAEDFPFAFQ